MTFERDERGEVRLCPVIGFSAGVFDAAVGLRLEYSTTRDQYAAGQGVAGQFVLTPEAALAVGQALTERAELLLRPADAAIS